MKYLKILIVLVVFILATGCKGDVTKVRQDVYNNDETLPEDTYRIFDVSNKISVIYGQTGSIYIKYNGEYKKVHEFLGSYPEVSPNKSAISFVTGEADSPGELYLYRFKDQEKVKLLDNDEGKNTPKVVKWLDNKRLLVIRGYGHGRVKMGGEVYVYNIDTEEITPILIPDKMSEYRTITKNGDNYEFELATWEDESYNKFNTKIVEYKASELKKLANK